MKLLGVTIEKIDDRERICLRSLVDNELRAHFPKTDQGRQKAIQWLFVKNFQRSEISNEGILFNQI